MINHLRRRIESIMYAANGGGDQRPLKVLLHAISRVYGGLQLLRREGYCRGWLPALRLPCKVVSVGNLAVGGTGKTPMAAFLARAFQQMGLGVVVIGRGYKGGGGRRASVVSDGRRVLADSRQSGDEAQLLARRLPGVPVMVGKDRYRAGMAALRRFRPDVIVLDDGFQHLRLERDLDLVLLDEAAPFGNGHLLPRGVLREPAKVLGSADGVVLTRSAPQRRTGPLAIDFLPAGMPVFRSAHRPYYFICNRDRASADGKWRYPALAHDFSRLENARVAVFSGIARNDDFQRVLRERRAVPVAVHRFADHHAYGISELKEIAADSRKNGADFLATTEKDFVRLPPDFAWPLDLVVVGVEIDFGGQQAAFHRFIRSRLA